MKGRILKKLFKIIEKREKKPVKGSYTNALFNGGTSKILEKIDEESGEVIKAIKEKEGKKRVVEEIDDLIYHLFVLMVDQGIRFHDLEKEEKKRMKK